MTPRYWWSNGLRWSHWDGRIPWMPDLEADVICGDLTLWLTMIEEGERAGRARMHPEAVDRRR